MAAPEGKKKKVFFIAIDEEIGEAVSKLLIHNGYEVTIKEKFSLHEFLESNCDLVIMDLEIKSSEKIAAEASKVSKKPIIGYTIHPIQEKMARIWGDRGVSNIINFPCTKQDLLNVLGGKQTP